MKYKARIFYNVVEELIITAKNEDEAQDKAREFAGTGKTITDEIDFVELDEEGNRA
jgi:hypothetical protein